MKKLLMCLTIFTTMSSFAFANNKCLEEAKIYARLDSAKYNSVSVSKIKVVDASFLDQWHDILTYKISLSNGDMVRIGVVEHDCSHGDTRITPTEK